MNSPFSLFYGPASATAPGYLTTGSQTIAGDKTINGALVVNKTAVASATEILAQIGVSDVAIASGGFDFINNTISDASVSTLLRMTATTTLANTLRFVSTTDTGSTAIGAIDCRIGASSGSTRPMLWLLRAGGIVWLVNAQGKLAFTPAAASSGATSAFAITNPADTAQTLSTEIPGFVFNTFTRQWATGAITTQREFLVKAPTYSFVGASTITTAATIVIDAAPIAGTNATITNAYALWVQAGMAQLDGGATFGLRANLKSYTVATLPAVGVAGGMVYVSDAAVAACVAFSNGTNWKRCDNAATTVV